MPHDPPGGAGGRSDVDGESGAVWVDDRLIDIEMLTDTVPIGDGDCRGEGITVAEEKIDLVCDVDALFEAESVNVYVEVPQMP